MAGRRKDGPYTSGEKPRETDLKIGHYTEKPKNGPPRKAAATKANRKEKSRD
jgi:hypothetical protein